MFRATHRPSSGALCSWRRPPTTRPTTFHVCKTRGCQCSFRLLMMGGVSPETCWALYKYGIINFLCIVASCLIFLYEVIIRAVHLISINGQDVVGIFDIDTNLGVLVCRLISWCFLRNILGNIGANFCFLECLNQTTSKIRVQQLRNWAVQNIPNDVRVCREPTPALSVLARPSCTSSNGMSCGRLFFTAETLTKNRSRLTENRVADFLCFYHFFKEDSN